jgi:hypothetical protein
MRWQSSIASGRADTTPETWHMSQGWTDYLKKTVDIARKHKKEIKTYNT